MAARLSELSIDRRHIELENISVSEIWIVRTVRQPVEYRSHVFSSLDEKNLCKVFECHYLKNGKHFLEFLLHFQNVHKILFILKKNMSFITWIFPKLFTPRNMVIWIPESSYFSTPFESQCVHGHDALLRRPWQHCFQTFQLIWDTLSWKTSLLVRSEMLGLFGNTSSADHIYSRH